MSIILDKNRLYADERAAINRKLADLPAYFMKPGRGLNAVCDILGFHGVQLDDAPTLTEHREETITYRFNIARMNPADSFSPYQLDDSVLVLTVYFNRYADSYEVLGYLS